MTKSYWTSIQKIAVRNWRVIGILLIAGYEAVTFAIDATGSQLSLFAPSWLKFLSLISFLVLVFTEIMSLRKTIETMDSLQPVIVPYNWVVDKRGTMQFDEFLGCPYFANVLFLNNSKYRNKGSTANKVIAKIEAYNLKGRHVLGPVIGRWGDTEQPVVRQIYPKTGNIPQVINHIIVDSQNSSEIDISPNGLPRELSIAIKWPESQECYLFNNSSYGCPKFENPKMRLKSDKLKIRVTLSGENVDDVEFWFLLINDGQSISLDRFAW